MIWLFLKSGLIVSNKCFIISMLQVEQEVRYDYLRSDSSIMYQNRN